jgi:uncharacterized membrane protein YhiD involved in acid resistance
MMLLPRTALALTVTFSLGTLIDLERKWRQRTAGLRTNVLVATDPAAFTDLGLLAATLLPTTTEPDELDGVVAALKRAGSVKGASWTVETEL